MTSRSKKPTIGLRFEKNYKIFAANFHGSGLIAVRNQFIKCVQEGDRLPVFLIDLDKELDNVARGWQMPFETKKLRRESKSRKESMQKSTDLMSITLAAIQRCVSEFDLITNILDKGSKFDILSYWLKNQNQTIDLESGRNLPKGKKSLKDGKDMPKAAGKGGGGGKDKRPGDNKSIANKLLISFPDCPKVLTREHNVLGSKVSVIKRQYIKDEPANSRLFIILVGTQLGNDFYIELMTRGEPLQAVVHFLPRESAYNVLVPNAENKQFLVRTIEQIQHDTYFLRQQSSLKPVGMFNEYLPVISQCLAQKYSSEVFDQLTWYFYDIENLHRDYHAFYMRPFNETNVSMESSANMQQLFETAASVSMITNHLNRSLPLMCTDLTLVALYLKSILSIFDDTATVRSENSDEMGDSLALSSVLACKKYSRLYIEKSNDSLNSLVAFMDLTDFKTIYSACLEYDELRDYVCYDASLDDIDCLPYNADREPVYLPAYVKMYLHNDVAVQRLNKMIADYPDYTVTEIYNGYRLFCFKQTYGEIRSTEKMTIIPTRLCFRDFTIFQMEEFLGALITPEMARHRKDILVTEEDKFKQYSIDYPNTFIRPRSLKASKYPDTASAQTRASKSDKGKTFRGDRRSVQQDERLIEGAGLPPNHPLLQGYNLEDVRQEILIKTSDYHFEEGSLRLYEERWCFTDMNKNLEISLHGCVISLNCPRNELLKVSKNIRILTPNDINIRIYPERQECGKVVLNYPNGLSVFYHETYAEQIWQIPDAHGEEHKRICTPYGAVIVFMKGDDLTRIMRYNGEVYELFQYYLNAGEEEPTNMSTDDMISKKSESSDAIGSHLKGKSKSKSKTRATDFDSSSLSSNFMEKRVTKKEMIMQGFADELRFIDYITHVYDLSFLHLRITSTLGKVLNVTFSGSVYEGPRVRITEWHDYFANESYAMRSDGVKIIWSQESMKCYHKDGTSIKTSLEESIERFDDESDFGFNEGSTETVDTVDASQKVPAPMRQSLFRRHRRNLGKSSPKRKPFAAASRHIYQHRLKLSQEKFKYVNVFASSSDDNLQPPPDLATLQKQLDQMSKSSHKNLTECLDDDDGSTCKKNAYEKFLIGRGEEGEDETKIPVWDPEVVTYMPICYSMEHEDYAEVVLFVQKDAANEMRILMEVYGADRTRVQVVRRDLFHIDDFPCMEDTPPGDTDSVDAAARSSSSSKSYNEDVDDADQRPSNFDRSKSLPDEMQLSYIIQVSVGDDLQLQVRENECRICTVIDQAIEESHCIIARGQHKPEPEINKEEATATSTVSDECESKSKSESECESDLMGSEGDDDGDSDADGDGDVYQASDDAKTPSVYGPTSLVMKFSFENSLIEVFHDFAQLITQFKQRQRPRIDMLYAIEWRDPDCDRKLFEFIDELPPLKTYHTVLSNTTTEFEKFMNVNATECKGFGEVQKDMMKFPRFRDRRKSPPDPLKDYPTVLQMNVYCKVPPSLATTERIHMFIEPFEAVTFKRFRPYMRETAEKYLRPNIRERAHVLYSEKSWMIKHEEHRRRLFTEEQRKALYHAMLKHKKYPSYQRFIGEYSSHVRHIGFFDYVHFHCVDKAERISSPQSCPSDMSVKH